MFKLYCEKQCVRFVAKKCRVSETTVRKYRKKDKWDARVEEVKADTRQKTDAQIANSLVLRISQYEKILDEFMPHLSPKHIRSIKDIGTLERLIMFLRGEPDSRPDTSADMPNELKPLLDKLRGNPDLCEQLGDRVADLVNIKDG